MRARTASIRVDSLGLRIAVARSYPDGNPVGSIAVQTVVGARDSRLVIKLGEMKCGALEASDNQPTTFSSFSNDYLRVRVQWSELRITLDEGRPIVEKNQAFFETAMDRIREAALPPSDTDTRRVIFPTVGTPPREKWVEARDRISLGSTNDDPDDTTTTDAVCTILLYRLVQV